VTAGQSLARIDDADLRQALSSSEAQLASAQARYAAAVQGPSATDITAAQQSIASANAQVGTALQNLDDLLAGPKAADIATAQQAVITAQTALQTANDAVPKAQNDVTKAQNDVAAAQTAVANAENNVRTARDGVTLAQNNVSAARNEVTLAESAMSTKRSELQIERTYLTAARDACNSSYSVPSVPSSGSQAQTALPLQFSFSCTAPAGQTQRDALSAAIGKYNAAVTGYNGAVSNVTAKQTAVTTAERAVTTAEGAVTTAQTAVTTAQNTLATAQTALTTVQNALNNGSLQRGIQNAQIGLTNAQQKYQEVLAGPKQAEIDNAQRALDSARASYASAQARLDALFIPPKPDVTLPLQAAVAQAQAEVEAARKNLNDATISAPFDGQIASITGEVGTQVSATTAVFVLLNPRLIRIDANADQADVSNLKVGQTANVTFDALQGRSYAATITAVGLTPTIQQGVVTYVVTLGVDTSRLAEGTPIPTPGMTASINVTTNRVENALVVPSRAVRRSGRTSVVTLKTADGSEQRNVTTGVTNGTLTQIVSGLQDGDEVLVSAPATTASSTTTGGQQNPQGFPGGGGGFQGGGGPQIIVR
jgi:HlyD family secretion protein